MDATERTSASRDDTQSTTSQWLRFGLLPFVARILLGAEFAIAANGKISGWDGEAAYMAAHGLHWTTPLLAMALVVELVGTLCLVTGLATRTAAAIMFVYLGIVSLSLHDFWRMSGNAAGVNQTQFFKNLGMMGGLLLVSAYGPGRWALSAVLARRQRAATPAARGIVSRRVALALAVILASVAARPMRAQTAADSTAIRETAMDYIEGWYAGDAARMERAVHPELAKRVVTTDARSGRSHLESIGAMTLVLRTRAGGGMHTPAERQQKDFRILDIFHDAAVAKIVASDWIDYLELARWNGRWVIVNVLWEYKPAAP